jgi:hypothetical protein
MCRFADSRQSDGWSLRKGQALDLLFELREEFAQWVEEAQDDSKREALENVLGHIEALQSEYRNRQQECGCGSTGFGGRPRLRPVVVRFLVMLSAPRAASLRVVKPTVATTHTERR